MTNKQKKILYIVHDAGIYGSQKSLILILENLISDKNEHNFLPFVSIARSGLLNDYMSNKLQIIALSHKRLQWFKHDKRNMLQRVTDICSLLFNLPFRVFVIYEHIKRNHIDLVHTNSAVSLEGALAAKLANVPHVWHIRELFMEDSPKLIPILGTKLTRTVIENFSARIICISKAVQAQFIRESKYELNCFPVIYNALDPSQIKMPFENRIVSAQPLRLGFAGRLSEGKGLHDLLEALIKLRDILPGNDQPTLNIAGNFVDESYKHRIQTFIQQHELSQQVNLMGYQENLADWYSKIDLLIIPSKNEPFGRIIIETMAQGVPCIGADSGGIPEIIDHNETGWLYPTGNSEALARQIASLSKDRARLNQVIQNAGRKVLERFTIEQQMRQIFDVYHSLLIE